MELERNRASFPKFYSIKFLGLSLDKANPIAIERSLQTKAGTFAAKTRKQNKDTLRWFAPNREMPCCWVQNNETHSCNSLYQKTH